MVIVPDVIPINELKNTAQISQKCKESDVPLIVTKNGYSELIMMSMSTFNKVIAEIQVAALINESLRDLKSGVELIDGDKVYSSLMEKYGKQV
ncbi:MAG: hypothetical protein LUD47_04990 [Clostridia bacterium]|nr:hypothetical protein [Clostridia bacterium]